MQGLGAALRGVLRVFWGEVLGSIYIGRLGFRRGGGFILGKCRAFRGFFQGGLGCLGGL